MKSITDSREEGEERENHSVSFIVSLYGGRTIVVVQHSGEPKKESREKLLQKARKGNSKELAERERSALWMLLRKKEREGGF